jgi:hypothetical protein
MKYVYNVHSPYADAIAQTALLHRLLLCLGDLCLPNTIFKLCVFIVTIAFYRCTCHCCSYCCCLTARYYCILLDQGSRGSVYQMNLNESKRCYYQAIRLHPDDGFEFTITAYCNDDDVAAGAPHNQLAVIATSIEEDLWEAGYRYIRR